jgi:hypothetical protein
MLSGAYFYGEVLRLTCGMRKSSLKLFQLICKTSGIFSSFIKIKPILLQNEFCNKLRKSNFIFCENRGELSLAVLENPWEKLLP